MIETIVRGYLVGQLSVPVLLEDPPDPPEAFVLLEKTGGVERNHIQTASLAVQSYGATLYKAAQLNEAVKDAMRSMTALPEISQCRLNSDYPYNDTATKRYRYQAVFDVVYY